MQKQEFIEAVADRTGHDPEDITDSMIRRAFSQGVLPSASRVAGWINYEQKHIEPMCEFVRTRTRLAFASRSAELVEQRGQIHGVR